MNAFFDIHEGVLNLVCEEKVDGFWLILCVCV